MVYLTISLFVSLLQVGLAKFIFLGVGGLESSLGCEQGTEEGKWAATHPSSKQACTLALSPG